MDVFHLLIVDDDKHIIDSFEETVDRYNEQPGREFKITAFKTIEGAKRALAQRDNYVDGAIIDLMLGNDEKGEEIISKIEEINIRIPIFVLTGQSDRFQLADNHKYIKVFTKGERESENDTLLDAFWEIHQSGMTRIIGGRGLLEEYLGEIFRKNLSGQMEKWIKYANQAAQKENKTEGLGRVERALIRHAMQHLIHYIDNKDETHGAYFAEEWYICPPVDKKIRCGSIVTEKSSEKQFVIMSPACDLVIRNEKHKTNTILLAEITDAEEKDKNKRQTFYEHPLCETNFFKGGIINFRYLKTVRSEEFDKEFDIPEIQISPPFIKDITARFSAYYGRQGQPELATIDSN